MFYEDDDYPDPSDCFESEADYFAQMTREEQIEHLRDKGVPEEDIPKFLMDDESLKRWIKELFE